MDNIRVLRWSVCLVKESKVKNHRRATFWTPLKFLSRIKLKTLKLKIGLTWKCGCDGVCFNNIFSIFLENLYRPKLGAKETAVRHPIWGNLRKTNVEVATAVDTASLNRQRIEFTTWNSLCFLVSRVYRFTLKNLVTNSKCATVVTNDDMTFIFTTRTQCLAPFLIRKGKGKGKAISVHVWRGPEGSRR